MANLKSPFPPRILWAEDSSPSQKVSDDRWEPGIFILFLEETDIVIPAMRLGLGPWNHRILDTFFRRTSNKVLKRHDLIASHCQIPKMPFAAQRRAWSSHVACLLVAFATYVFQLDFHLQYLSTQPGDGKTEHTSGAVGSTGDTSYLRILDDVVEAWYSYKTRRCGYVNLYLLAIAVNKCKHASKQSITGAAKDSYTSNYITSHLTSPEYRVRIGYSTPKTGWSSKIWPAYLQSLTLIFLVHTSPSKFTICLLLLVHQSNWPYTTSLEEGYRSIRDEIEMVSTSHR